MCVNPGKERLIERLSARRKRKAYCGVKKEDLRAVNFCVFFF